MIRLPLIGDMADLDLHGKHGAVFFPVVGLEYSEAGFLGFLPVGVPFFAVEVGINVGDFQVQKFFPGITQALAGGFIGVDKPGIPPGDESSVPAVFHQVFEEFEL